MADTLEVQVETLQDKDRRRGELLEKARVQIKKVANREIRRLKNERALLKSLSTEGIDDAKSFIKEIDEVLVLNELDDLLGGGTS
jgi:hypothetical protein